MQICFVLQGLTRTLDGVPKTVMMRVSKGVVL